MKLRIRMIKSDLANGVRRCSTACPIAYAVNRKLSNLHPSYRQTKVGYDTVVIQFNNYPYSAEPVRIIAKISKKAEEFAVKFDKGDKVKPVSFTLEFPESEVPENVIKNKSTSRL